MENIVECGFSKSLRCRISNLNSILNFFIKLKIFLCMLLRSPVNDLSQANKMRANSFFATPEAKCNLMRMFCFVNIFTVDSFGKPLSVELYFVSFLNH